MCFLLGASGVISVLGMTAGMIVVVIGTIAFLVLNELAKGSVFRLPGTGIYLGEERAVEGVRRLDDEERRRRQDKRPSRIVLSTGRSRKDDEPRS